jgi:hypothetical protein
MNKLGALLIILLFGLQSVQSQENINNYAYVIVPEQFHFQKDTDEYQLNSLSQFLFKRSGMKAFKNVEKIPADLSGIDCGGLRMKLNKESSAFRIKLCFELVNCRNQIVFKSELGSTTHKDFKKGYQEAVRNAFKSFEALNYKFEGKINKVASVVSQKVQTPIVGKAEVSKGNSSIYSNSNLSLSLKENNGSFIGKVLSSESINYTVGDLICKLFKTSLPNVFKVEWKDTYGNFITTIGYFNEAGALNIDMATPAGISVMKFTK